MSTPNTPACPLRQLLASRHLEGSFAFDWPDDSHCPDCGDAWADCECAGS